MPWCPEYAFSVELGAAASRVMAMVAIAVIMGVLLAGTVLPFVAVGGLAARQVAEAVDTMPADLRMEPLPVRSELLDRHGNVAGLFYRQNRINVSLADVAPVMQQAVLAIEDARFYEHGALDLRGTLRAFVQNQAEDEVAQGGSTLTQQLVKMTLVNQARTAKEREAATAPTYGRKLRELRYAVGVEEAYDKDWILERYLNTAYFGDGAYGVEAASQHFFSRSASEVTLPQAALLAGLVKNPTGYDPTENPRAARQRRDLVLDRMGELGMIPRARAARAQRSGLDMSITPTPNGCVDSVAPFFCDYVHQYLIENRILGPTVKAQERVLTTRGLSIATSLDTRMQRAADTSVRRHVYPTDEAIGALAMVEPGTGAVRALAQSRPMGVDQKRGQTFLNYLTPPIYGDANGFQAGSTFKVFVLAAAIRQGIPLNTRIRAPKRISLPANRYRTCDGRLRSTDIWTPRNSTDSGTFNLYTGTRQSVNTFYAQLELRTGLCQPYRLARRMGIRLPGRAGMVPTFTLGVAETDPLSMAEAYATFAARGIHCSSNPLTQIRDPDGDILATSPRRCERVLPEHVADAVNDVLRGVQEPGGFGHSAGISLRQPSAGKTGTIDRNMAVWFIGYTPHLAAASMLAGADRNGHWVTLNRQTVGGVHIEEAFGSTHAGPMWGDAMKVIQKWLPDRDFVKPPRWVITGDKPGGGRRRPGAGTPRSGLTPAVSYRQDPPAERTMPSTFDAVKPRALRLGRIVTVPPSDSAPQPVGQRKHRPRRVRVHGGS